MAVRNIARKAAQVGFATASAAPIRVDTTTNTPFYNGVGSGSTEIEIVDVSSAQSLSNKTITGIIEADTKVLAASQTFTSTTVLTTLTGLTGTLVAGKTYQFEIELYTTQTTNGGLAAALKYTTATLTSIQLSSRQMSASAIAVASSTVTTDATKFVDNKTAAYLVTQFNGTLVVLAGGTVDVQVAQNTSNTDTTTVALGSYARFTRIN